MDTNTEVALKAQLDGLGEKITSLINEMNKASAAEKAALEAKIKTIETAQAALSEQLQKAERLHLPGVEVTKTGEKNKFSYTRLAQIMGGVRKESDPEVGYEIEVCNQMQKRFDGLPVEMKTAINAASGAGGAFLIPTEVDVVVPFVFEAVRDDGRSDRRRTVESRLGEEHRVHRGAHDSLSLLGQSAVAFRCRRRRDR